MASSARFLKMLYNPRLKFSHSGFKMLFRIVLLSTLCLTAFGDDYAHLDKNPSLLSAPKKIEAAEYPNATFLERLRYRRETQLENAKAASEYVKQLHKQSPQVQRTLRQLIRLDLQHLSTLQAEAVPKSAARDFFTLAYDLRDGEWSGSRAAAIKDSKVLEQERRDQIAELLSDLSSEEKSLLVAAHPIYFTKCGDDLKEMSFLPSFKIIAELGGK